MNDLVPIFIIGFIVLGIYKILALYAKKNERMALIEKISFFSENKDLQGEINLPNLSFGKQDYGSWPLRISLLLVGVGLGCIIAFFAQYYYFDSFLNYNQDDWYARDNVSQIKFILNFSFISIFGGLGLLIAYLIELKQGKKEK